MGKTKRLVQGVGINDADYTILESEYLEEILPSGRNKQRQIWRCPYYSRWYGMLFRCYSRTFHNKNPTYKDCTVCDEWLTFSNFKRWMFVQDWRDKHLDKDLLLTGNKEYSEATCVFIPQVLNNFIITQNRRCISNTLSGVHWDRNRRKYSAVINNPFISKKVLNLGRFKTQLEAHLAWKKKKHEYALQLADSEYVTDERVAEALRNKYKNYDVYEENL